MKRLLGILCALGILVAITCSAASWAAVIGQPVTVPVRPGFTFLVPLQLTSDQVVAGVNGELSFDASTFGSPQVIAGSNMTGVTVLGNSPQAGKYRFIVYSDPSAALNLTPPLVYIRLQTANIAPTAATQTLSYTIAAASSPAGVLLTNVNFQNVTVLTEAAAARDWAVYQ